MRCMYCHNPDTWNMEAGEEMSAAEILDKAERFRSYWGEKGGITVSGGEPLLQIDFLLELFQEAKKRGINTCLDTAGQPYRGDGEFGEKFRALMGLTDTVLFDLKHATAEGHKELTGFDNGNIQECVEAIGKSGVKIWIRHVLVPGKTDSEEHLRALRAKIDRIENVERVEVLPYHTMAKYKYEKLGIPYRLGELEPPTKESVEKAKEILGAR